MKRKLFCEISPLCYKISLKKEVLLRNIRDAFSGDKIACGHSTEELPNIVKGHTSLLLRKLHGVDMTLQENKVTNIRLACDKINGIIIEPDETFSFWRTVGPATKENGFLEGMTISGGKVGKGYGGGLCQMANMIHWLVLNSPLDVTEIHHHSDALFPDEKRRVPFGTGTSVFYNRLDFRFKNTSDQRVQILVWIADGELCGELRSERPFPYRYKLVEEGNRYRKEGDDYYRISQVYRLKYDRATGELLGKELRFDNHSRVLYDHSLIPQEEISNE